MTYEILNHPADIKFRTNGETLEEAFSEVVKAMSELVGGAPENQQPKVTDETKIEATNLEALLFDFLNQLILFQDLEDVIVVQAENLQIDETESGYRLSGGIHAVPILSDQPLLDIKGPTYSQMMINQNGGWTIEAVLDV